MALYPSLELVSPHVAVVWLGEGENRFTTPFLTRLESLLEQVLKDKRYSAVSVLVTCGKGRFYSNGMDVDWLDVREPASQREYFRQLNQVLMRILTYPITTVAAVNGHAFGGGALLAMAHDARIMQTKHGWLSLPEVFMDMRFAPAVMEMMRCKVPTQAIRNFILLGHRLTAEQAHSCGMIDTVATTNNWKDLLQAAIELGQDLLAGRDVPRPALETLKIDLYTKVLRLMKADNGDLAPRGLAVSKL